MAKRTTGAYERHIQIALDIFSGADSCRRENIALRSILRKQGLSDRVIQSRVKRILKKPDQDQTGAQMLKQLSEEMIKRLRDLDAQGLLEKIDPIGGVQ